MEKNTPYSIKLGDHFGEYWVDFVLSDESFEEGLEAGDSDELGLGGVFILLVFLVSASNSDRALVTVQF